MTVHIYLGSDLQGQAQEIAQAHEFEGVRKICAHLWDKLHNHDREFAVIANLRRTSAGQEISPDLVVVSELGLGVIELKDYYGMIDCDHPRGTWRAGPIDIKPFQSNRAAPGAGAGYRNPHEQVQSYASRIRADLLRQNLERPLSRDAASDQWPKIQTSICFTHPDAILSACKAAVRHYYRPDKELLPWEAFSVITPAETPAWVLSLRFETESGPADHYRPFSFSSAEVLRLASGLLCSVEWREMTGLMNKERLPYAYLAMFDAGRQAQPYRLDHDEVWIGRDPETCGIVISGRYTNVSRQHARLLRSPGGAWIEDLGSKHGTFVDGRPVRGQRVALTSSTQAITLGGPAAGETVCELRFTKKAAEPNLTSD